jgi:hypothetical protein
MERTPEETDPYYIELDRIVDTENVSYDDARRKLGPPPAEAVEDTPSAEVPAQRTGYEPVRDERGVELPSYYGKYRPPVPPAGSGRAEAMEVLAALRRAKRGS